MLQVARRRALSKKQVVTTPKKPLPPAVWAYPLETVTEFFWDWLRAGRNPALTPDGKPWIDQDRAWWQLVYYLDDLLTWATYRAEHPVMQIKPNDMTLRDL